MATLQVRGIDDRLYKALAARAAQNNRSISQEVVTIIQDYLGRRAVSHEEATRQILAMAGTWEDPRSAEEIVKDIRSARRSGRRFKVGGDVFD